MHYAEIRAPERSAIGDARVVSLSRRCWVLPVVAWLACGTAGAQDLLADWLPRTPKGTRPIKQYSACGDCHSRQVLDNGDQLDLSDYRDTVASTGGWILKGEALIWSHADKHSQAGIVLSSDNPLTARMEGLLEIKAARDLRCLACHTSAPTWEAPAAPDETWARPYLMTGVDCEGCHGPAGDVVTDDGRIEFQGWHIQHIDAARWRYLDPAIKRDVHGYVDIRSPKTQARVCLSCHLGERRLNRVVTHEMYAAGHPPLGGFALDTYREQMPRHWAMFHEKPAEVRADFFAKAKDARVTERPRTQLLMVSAVMALHQTAQLVADLAEDRSALTPDGEELARSWPELAMFECAACHHDLKAEAWRQEAALDRGRRTPGRPLIREWSILMAQLAAQAAGRSEESWERRVTPLLKALDERPFGIPAEVVRQSREVAAWADELAEELENRDWNAADLRPLARRLAEAGARTWPEYESARGLLWSIETVLSEAGVPQDQLARLTAEPRGAFVMQLHASSRDRPSLLDRKLTPEQYADRVSNMRLPLKVPRDDFNPVELDPGLKPGRFEIPHISLDKIFDPIAAYDARVFREACRKLAERLAEAQP
jgi:hypothetical protein